MPVRETTASGRLLLVATAIGALFGAALPFVVGGASLPIFTDVEARIGFGLLAAVVYAVLGSAAGWAVGSLILRGRAGRRPPSS